MHLAVEGMAWQETEALRSSPWISGQAGEEGVRQSPLNLRDCQQLCVCFLRDGVSVWAHVKPASFILEKVAVDKEPEKILCRKDTSGCYPPVCIATAKPPRTAYSSSSSEVVCCCFFPFLYSSGPLGSEINYSVDPKHLKSESGHRA